MEYGDRWQKAKSAATDAIRGLGAGDRASLVFFSSGAEVAVRSARRSRPSRVGPRRGRHGPGRHPLCAGAEARGQPARRIRAAAARDHPDQRLPAARLGADARPRRREAAGADDADAGQRRRRARRPTSRSTPVSLQRTRFENHDRVVVTAGVVNHGKKPVTGATLALEIDGNAIQSLPTDVAPGGSSSVTFSPVHRRVAQHARHGAPAGRRLEARQRVPLRRLAVRARAGPGRSIAAARSARRCTCRARSPSASRRASSCTTRTPTTVSDADLRQAVGRPRERHPGARRSRGPPGPLRRRGRRAVHRRGSAMRRGPRSPRTPCRGCPAIRWIGR